MGINLDPNSDGETNLMWVNVLHQMRAWGQPGQAWVRYTGPLSTDGYPLQDSDGLMQIIGYPNGTYKASWTGHATVGFSGMATAVSTPVTSGSATSVSVTIDHTASPYLFVQVRNVDPNNPIDNLTISPSGYKSTLTFSAGFVKRVTNFQVFRCMDLFGTNNSTIVNWSDRVTPTQAIWTSSAGIPYEAAITLSNTLKKDIWINVPAQASDDFVHQMAQLFVQNINPNVNIYVEYSNELWNGQFSQSQYVAAQAQGNPALSGDPNFVTAEQIALRLKQIADIFRQEFGSRQNQIKPVLAGQLANPWWGQTGLAYIQKTFGPPANYFAGYAVAPYVGGKISETTLDQLFADLNSSLTGTIIPSIVASGQTAQQYGLPLLAYEGGQGLVCYQDTTKLNLLTQAQDDPRMGTLYQQLYQTGWYGNQGGLAMHYSLCSPVSVFGAWGLLDNLDDSASTTSTKWSAIMQILFGPGH